MPRVVRDVLQTPGHSMDGGMRSFMEPRFGHDFGGVRVHTDAQAAASADAVNARSYTVGNHVVFGDGQYSPRLMAHELAHVVQQATGASNTTIYRSSIDTTAPPSPTPESIIIPEGPECDPTKDEGYPSIKRGAHRHAVGLAQSDLNVLLPQVKACLTNPDCMKGYSGKAQNFMKEQIDALSQLPIAVDCKYGLDTLHAVYAVQAYFFKDEKFWTGKIGPQTWYAIDAAYRTTRASPPYTPDQF